MTCEISKPDYVWVVASRGAEYGLVEVHGVTKYASQALELMREDDVAVQFKLGEDYRDIHQFLTFTKSDLKLRLR